jgi:hypothetical protein
MGVPGAAGFRFDMGESGAGRRIGNADEVLAGGTLNLPARVTGLAGQGLITVGTIEFEFVGVHGRCPNKRKTRGKSMSKFLPILFAAKLRLIW